MAFKGFMSSKTRPHTIELEGEQITLQFLPISLRKLLTLQDVIGVAIKALTRLTEDRNPQFSSRVTRDTDTEGKQYEVVETEPVARTVDYKDRDAAVDDLLNAVMHSENVQVLVSLMLNSLRDDPRVVDVTVDEFLDNTEPAALVQIAHGFIKANEKVLPAAFRKKLHAIKDKILARMGQDENDANQPPQPGEPSAPDSSENPGNLKPTLVSTRPPEE